MLDCAVHTLRQNSETKSGRHRFHSQNPLLLYFQQKLGLLFFTNGYYDFSEKLWKTGDEKISDSRWSTIDEFQTYPIMLDRLAFDKWWFPKFSRVRIWPFYNIKIWNNIGISRSALLYCSKWTLTGITNSVWKSIELKIICSETGR